MIVYRVRCGIELSRELPRKLDPDTFSDQNWRLLTDGEFGQSYSMDHIPFQWKEPLGAEDRSSGARCSETGFLGPGHTIVERNGKIYIDDFAPEDMD